MGFVGLTILKNENAVPSIYTRKSIGFSGIAILKTTTITGGIFVKRPAGFAGLTIDLNNIQSRPNTIIID